MKEVNRNAHVGECVRVTANLTHHGFKIGQIVKCTAKNKHITGVHYFSKGGTRWAMNKEEYVVLVDE